MTHLFAHAGHSHGLDPSYLALLVVVLVLLLAALPAAARWTRRTRERGGRPRP